MERTKKSNYHPEDEVFLERIKYTPQLIKGMKKADLILSSDWHIREDTPTCFIGDFQIEQWKAVATISILQELHECPVFHAGDLFHHWKPSPWLLSQAIDLLPKQFWTIYGQHDLPQHNWQLKEKSGLCTLEAAGKVKILDGTHYGQEPGKPWVYTIAKPTGNIDRKILVWHHMTYLSKPFPGAEGGMAEGILRKYPQFDLIVTGDNHQSFTIEYKGRRLVNPGNITRQTADQMDFKPCVYLWYAEDNSVVPVFLPIQDGVISREHIDIKEQRDSRIQAFISRLDGDWQVELSFEENLEHFCLVNKIRESVKQLIYNSLDS